MQLFSGSTDAFVGAVTRRQIADQLRGSFFQYYGYQPTFSEVQSWENSLAQFALVLNAARLQDGGIVVEMELPSTSSRLDCLVFGESSAKRSSALLVELKQWSQAEPAEPENCVSTFLGKAQRTVAHPSLQSLNYARYLADSVTSYFEEDDGIAIRPCSYLHNLDAPSTAALRQARYTDILAQSPMFGRAETDELIAVVRETVGSGQGTAVMQRALTGKHRPSKKLLEHTAAMVAGEPRYTLLDEQIVAYETILAEYRRARRAKAEHSVVVVRGGPGTGKSVIALNLVGTLSKLGVHVRHATGSKAFTQTLWKVLGTRTKPQFRYFNQFGAFEEADIDVLVCDEAHRIRKSSNSQYTKRDARSEISQVEELLRAAKTSVFFLDDHQAVRPNEIGSSHLIRETSAALGYRYREIDLRAQFRCAGSETYLEWLDQLLEIRKTGTMQLPADDRFEFDIVDSPSELDARVRSLIALGRSARLTAGFCWTWSDPDSAGRLIDDVVVGEFRRPWNAKPEARKLAKGIPPAPLWAWTPSGVDQVGCIYTAQGFEFDHVGVIFGTDLVVRDGRWVGQPQSSKDSSIKRGSTSDVFTTCVKNAYRVLLSRGLKGCLVTFLDDETRAHVERRLSEKRRLA